MASHDRQRVEKVPGRRRARLTPAPGTTAEPVPADERPDDAQKPDAGPSRKGERAASGPNDERMRRDVPPHY